MNNATEMKTLRGPWTKGPWKAVNRAGSMQVDGGGGTVCERLSWSPDASLIAAAPDLADTCQKILDDLREVEATGLSSMTRLEQIVLLSAAINKARGK